jgi:hypothetical protein
MKETFKVLQFKEAKTRESYGLPYVEIIEISKGIYEMGVTSNPRLRPNEATIETMQKIYKKIDFSRLEFVTKTLLDYEKD